MHCPWWLRPWWLQRLPLWPASRRLPALLQTGRCARVCVGGSPPACRRRTDVHCLAHTPDRVRTQAGPHTEESTPRATHAHAAPPPVWPHGRARSDGARPHGCAERHTPHVGHTQAACGARGHAHDPPPPNCRLCGGVAATPLNSSMGMRPTVRGPAGRLPARTPSPAAPCQHTHRPTDRARAAGAHTHSLPAARHKAPHDGRTGIGTQGLPHAERM